jgi:large subunit ribosomal protein LP0
VQALRAMDSVILMGKNTLMKRCLKVYIENTGNDKWQCLYDQLLGNVGLVFTAVRA